MLPDGGEELAVLTRRWGAATATLLALAFVAGCSGSSDSTTAETAPLRSEPTASSEPVSSEPVSSDEPVGDSRVVETPPLGSVSHQQVDGCESGEPVADVQGEHTDVVEAGKVDGVTVSAALYPLPHNRGSPWSQWGQGIVLPSGRFVSAVGDHLGENGNSWFYEFDPESGRLTRTADVSKALDHDTGDWGYGKIHAPMAVGPCGEVIAATYWGTRRNLVLGDSYQGDHLLRYDPATSSLTSLGVPVTGFGIPSLAISPDGRQVYGEAVDPESDPDAGEFFVADAETGEVIFRSDDERHVGFRSIMVGSTGTAYFSAGDGRLFRYEPESDELTIADSEIPGEWLRAASAIASNGSVYGVSRKPDRLFEMTPDGRIIDMGPTQGYVTSVALSPDGATLYYVPDAHGRSWMNGTPLIGVDTATGGQSVVVELNPLIEEALGVRLGGTYDVAVDPASGRIYVGLNASPADGNEPEEEFGSVVLAVVDLE
jgi:DNA-binding beta-propeller fold protein YncE